ncbi:MAG: hypothetical protein KF891_24955 [Rhizobacter sp.]|nr:hypothetical protein [Rhizobacter sp.]
MQNTNPHQRLALAALLCAGLAACASNPVDAQWSDPQLVVANPLRGARVLVVCESSDEVLRRLCTDQVGAQLAAAGSVPVLAPDVGGSTSAPGGPAPYVSAARASGTKAVFVTSVAPASTVAKPGFTVGFGIGGFGGGVGGGVGVSAPVGPTKVATGYAANVSVTDVASGRLMWTARASEAASEDINAQVEALAKKVVAGAVKAGLL